MWEYVKGNEADFEGAPEWAKLRTKHYWYETDEKGQGRYLYTGEGAVEGIGPLFNQSDLIIAQRRKVDNLQSRVNDANLQQGVNNAERIRRETWSAVSGEPLNTESLIAERGTRYGEFKDGAAIMQQLKDVMKFTPKWGALKPSQKESLEMIQHKIGRILNGDPDYDDNWKDIAGYATLIAKELSK